ncbi:uncharacterized protein LOC143920176 [Arctopsyche grandis]|uniref:uncharacterized protein LOC143920176 n=1 Tax=Arctopsyche grandis TaxID=121162 RepID=UPI00406D9C54
MKQFNKNENEEQYDEIINVLNRQSYNITNTINLEHKITREIFKTETQKMRHEIYENLKKFTNEITLSKENSYGVEKPIIFGLFDPVASFAGRREELQNLHTKLTERQKTTIISQAATITGLGGIGKTTLAMKYALDYSTFYYNIVFIKSEKVENIVKSFKDLAINLGIEKETGEQNQSSEETRKQDRGIKEIVQDIYRHLNNKNKSLIILDNVEDYDDVKDYIFKGSSINRHIYTLITSRRKDWDAGDNGEFEMISLEVFSEKDANDYVSNILTYENQDNVKKLTKQLGNLPLALKQATSYIKRRNKIIGKWSQEKKFSIADYLILFKEQEELLLNSGPIEKDDVYDQNLTTTWQISLDRIKKDTDFGELAVKIFQIISYLSPDDIQVVDLFCKLESDIEKLRGAIELLDEYSVINLVNGRVNVHRLVQQVTRLNLRIKNEEESTLEDALNLLDNSDYEEHAVCVWEYASEYSQLLSKFYCESKYGTNRNSPLHLLAAYRDDCIAIKKIWENSTMKIDVDCKSGSRRSPIENAIESGNKNVVEFLLEKGANLGKIRNALYSAASKGRDEVVKFLYGIDESLADYEIIGQTPLDVAVLNGHPKVVSILKPYGNDELMFHAELRSGIFQKNYAICETLIKDLLKKNLQYLNLKFGKNKENILHFAAENGDNRVMEILLTCNIEIDICDSRHMTPIYYAIEKANVNVLQLLLDNGANINIVNNYGIAPIHYAVLKNDEAVCKMILTKSPNINAVDKVGKTPIHYAVKNQYETVCEMILAHSPNIDFVDNDGKTAIHYAAENDNESICKMLLAKGPNINIPDKFGKTLIHYVIENQNLVIWEMLLAQLQNIDIVDRHGKTPLHHAVCLQNVAIFSLTLAKKPNINVADNLSKTALHYAVEKNNETICEMILAKDPNIDIRDIDGLTPIHCAILCNYECIIKMILTKSPNINIFDMYGKSPIHLAAENGNEALFKLILDIPSIDKKNALFVAAYHGKSESIFTLLENGADIKSFDKNGKNLLHFAANRCNSDTLKLLVDKGLNIHAKDKSGRSALHYSAEGRNKDGVLFFIQNGIDVNLLDKVKCTPLLFTLKTLELYTGVCRLQNTMGILFNKHERVELVINMTIETVKLLLENGANPNMSDDDGYTSLHMAVIHTELSCVKLLLQYGGDFNAINSYGITPLMIANSCRSPKIRDCLNSAHEKDN